MCHQVIRPTQSALRHGVGVSRSEESHTARTTHTELSREIRHSCVRSVLFCSGFSVSRCAAGSISLFGKLHGKKKTNPDGANGLFLVDQAGEGIVDRPFAPVHVRHSPLPSPNPGAPSPNFPFVRAPSSQRAAHPGWGSDGTCC